MNKIICNVYSVYQFLCSFFSISNGTRHENGSGSSVGIGTDYGLDGQGSNPGGEEIFPPVYTGPGAHTTSCKMGTGFSQGVKCGRGVPLTTHPPSSAVVMEE